MTLKPSDIRHAASGAPAVTDMQVIPVAGEDSMLLNLSGAHAPLFTRNIVILRDNAGHTGVGEVPGGERIRQTLEDARPLVIGRSIGAYHGVLQRHAPAVRRPRQRRARPANVRSAHHDPRRNGGRGGASRSARAASGRAGRGLARRGSAARPQCGRSAICSMSAIASKHQAAVSRRDRGEGRLVSPA